MKPLSAFRSRVSVHVAGCSDPMIDQAVLDTCFDFCDKSLIVKRMVDSFLTTPSVMEYDVSGDSQQSVCNIQRVWCDDKELTPLTEDALKTPYGFVSSIPGQTLNTSTPRFFNETSPGLLAFFPPPDKAYTINVRVALRPTRSATMVEDQLFDEWMDAIIAGALSRLFMIPGEFASPGLAKVYKDRYEADIDTAQLQAHRGSTRAQSRVIPVRI